jgi:c(7)-type cytochrome triheme protein
LTFNTEKLLCIFMLIALFSAPRFAGASFRDDFIAAYYANRHEYRAALVKKNKAIIPSEVTSLIEETTTGEKTFDEKMQLLDIASAMASIHKHSSNDPAPLDAVEKLQRELMKTENKLLAEAQKWAVFESYTGNILMRSNIKEPTSATAVAVVFPHWTHRLWYACSSCHNNLFEMKRTDGAINHTVMAEGRYCGACHDGKTAFGAESKQDCALCHSAVSPPPALTYNAAKIDLNKVKETAEKLGAQWTLSALKNNKLPVDKFGFIDWTELRQSGANRLIAGAVPESGKAKNKIRENTIIFTPRIQGIASVAFNHGTHSADTLCETCHPSVFQDLLGGNIMTMSDMAEGRFCGFCHGKTAFKFADCKKCHGIKPGEKPEGANVLIR